ncbi:MAG: amino acid amidase [Epulopiscium sp. Nele67-Bin001]|nr:MAG: amino acid amidase [Epulopiscium sp. Nele67-Bin001]
MKIYISADIEGISSISTWQESDMAAPKEARDRMTQEVKAACEAAFQAGATEVMVKDAHGYGKNIRHEDLPVGVQLINGWSNHPYNMVEGIDETYDGVIFLGYHSGASTHFSPLAHTLDTNVAKIKVNGEISSEFSIYSTLTQILGIPILTVTGDGGIIREVMEFDPMIETVAVKEGFAGAMISNHPKVVYEQIKDSVKKGIEKIGEYNFVYPSSYNMEVTFVRHKDAYKYSFYPGVEQIDANTVRLKTENYFEILSFLVFI